jgi:PAS domain S-box-containing protein
MPDSAEKEENWVKYYTLFNTANDGILLMNKEEFIDCNPKALELFGITRSEFCGSNPIMFSPEKQPDGQLSSVKALFYIDKALQGEPQFFEWLHIRHNGQEFYAEVSLNRFLLKGEYLLQNVKKWNHCSAKVKKNTA